MKDFPVLADRFPKNTPGIDPSTSLNAGLLNANDRSHLDFACGDGRVLVTPDHDFVRLHRAGVHHADIAY